MEKSSWLSLRIINILLLGSAISTGGCMLTPGDGTKVSSKTDPIYFSGWTNNPSTRVTVQAKMGGEWVSIGRTRSSSSPATLEGLTGYAWSTSLVVPWSFWSGCGSNHRATVRARASSNSLITVVDNGAGCWVDDPGWGPFIENCIAENHPEAVIYSYLLCSGGGGGGIPPGGGGGGSSSCSPELTGTKCGSGKPSGCQQGFSVDKVWKCVNNEDVCDFPQEGATGSYCNGPWGGEGGSSNPEANCGLYSGGSCSGHNQCYPGTICNLQYSSGTKCGENILGCENIPQCWMVADKASLCSGDAY